MLDRQNCVDCTGTEFLILMNHYYYGVSISNHFPLESVPIRFYGSGALLH